MATSDVPGDSGALGQRSHPPGQQGWQLHPGKRSSLSERICKWDLPSRHGICFCARQVIFWLGSQQDIADLGRVPLAAVKCLLQLSSRPTHKIRFFWMGKPVWERMGQVRAAWGTQSSAQHPKAASFPSQVRCVGHLALMLTSPVVDLVYTSFPACPHETGASVRTRVSSEQHGT